MNAIPERAPRAWLVIALSSMAVLIYQVAVTRLLSVVLWYHFAFLSISVAMLGLGAAGVWLSVRGHSPGLLPRALLVSGISIPLSVIVIVQARPAVLALGLGQTGWLAVLAIAMTVPMFALGLGVCALLLQAPGREVGRMYAADLFGAAAGAALVVPLMWHVPTPVLLALAGLLPLTGFALLQGWRNPAWAACVAAIVLAALWGAPFAVGYSKIHAERGDFQPLHEVWTPTARIAVFDRPIFSPTPDIPWGWGYGARFQPVHAREMWIDQDGSAGTPIEQLRGAPAELGYLFYDITTLGYQLLRPERVCIVGAGGGRDIVSALAAGARRVDAVEINRAIVDLLRGPLAEFSGDIYRRPGVTAHVSEGRSFLARTDQRYDLLQISLVDSWAATAAGAFALSENYLYTVEALRLYLERLAPGGVVSISRWTDQVQPLESARLMLMAKEALRQHGVSVPNRHLMFASGSNVGTLLMRAEPWRDQDVEAIDRIAQERGFVRHWPVDPRQPVRSLVSLAMLNGAEPFERSGFDVEPPVDDRPFFFQANRVFTLRAEEHAQFERDVNLRSVETLRVFVAVLACLTLALFFSPFVLTRRRALPGPRPWTGSAYFLLVGVAFMLLEVPWLHASILLLGHPSLATSVTLGALLLGAGLGSLAAARLGRQRLGLGLLLVALPVVAGLVTLALPPLFGHALQHALPARVGVALLCFVPAGFLLGTALPAGFMRFGEQHKAWFWAMNGTASVLASALSIALSIAFGFQATALAGVALYSVAVVTLALGTRAMSPSNLRK